MAISIGNDVVMKSVEYRAQKGRSLDLDELQAFIDDCRRNNVPGSYAPRAVISFGGRLQKVSVEVDADPVLAYCPGCNEPYHFNLNTGGHVCVHADSCDHVFDLRSTPGTYINVMDIHQDSTDSLSEPVRRKRRDVRSLRDIDEYNKRGS
jgi:hypothetical protein